MQWIGVGFCALAAMMHAVGFVMSRRYTVARHTTALRLLVISHVWMGAIAATLLLTLWPDDLPPAETWRGPVLHATWPYMLAQTFLFLCLRRTDASRISPLLGLKIVAVALLYVLWLDQPMAHQQWAAVVIAMAAAFALNYAGGSLPVWVVAAMLVTVSFFSVSDVHVRHTLDALSEMGVHRRAFYATLLYYCAAGSMAVAALPWLGSRTWADWRAAFPYALVWITSIGVMFVGFDAAGIVLGNIALATRGLWSIVLGAVIAHRGHHHLERKHSLATNIRRSVAAAAMVGAIVLFVWV